MIPNHLSKILLVQALEESDLHGKFLPLSTRHHATQQARANGHPLKNHSTKTSLAFLQKRTEIIWAFLNQSYPNLTQAWSRLHPHIPASLVAVPALVAGLLVNGLGTSQRVNLLNFPLLLILGWNVGAYLITAMMKVANSSTPGTWLSLPAHWLAKFVGQWEARAWPTRHGLNSSATAWIQDAIQRFTAVCWRETQHLWIQRLRLILHLGAACMALGIVLGLYIRGLALDYQATWESTFLGADQVHAVLHILLGPAAWVLQYPFPTVSDIVNLQAPQHGPAAPWIHLWAVTALAVIVIPRILMACIGQRSLKRARETFTLPLHDPYFVHLLAPDRGEGVHVAIMPYSYQPSSAAKAFLESNFLDLFGNLSTLQWQPMAPFGQEIPCWPAVSTPTRTFVVVFNAGQTPEWEVQGEWLNLIQTQIGTMEPIARLLVVLDEEPYRQTVDQARVSERRQTWQRLGTQYHLTLVPFDVHTTSHDQFLQDAQTGLWPKNQ
ncbi:MAG: hypothetical protein R3B74_16050 [Nitrospirales bacterium]|nr:DUF2868 domain-containing protein [Nitrospirales bacterium]